MCQGSVTIRVFYFCCHAEANAEDIPFDYEYEALSRCIHSESNDAQPVLTREGRDAHKWGWLEGGGGEGTPAALDQGRTHAPHTRWRPHYMLSYEATFRVWTRQSTYFRPSILVITAHPPYLRNRDSLRCVPLPPSPTLPSRLIRTPLGKTLLSQPCTWWEGWGGRLRPREKRGAEGWWKGWGSRIEKRVREKKMNRWRERLVWRGVDRSGWVGLMGLYMQTAGTHHKIKCIACLKKVKGKSAESLFTVKA